MLKKFLRLDIVIYYVQHKLLLKLFKCIFLNKIIIIILFFIVYLFHFLLSNSSSYYLFIYLILYIYLFLKKWAVKNYRKKSIQIHFKSSYYSHINILIIINNNKSEKISYY